MNLGHWTKATRSGTLFLLVSHLPFFLALSGELSIFGGEKHPKMKVRFQTLILLALFVLFCIYFRDNCISFFSLSVKCERPPFLCPPKPQEVCTPFKDAGSNNWASPFENLEWSIHPSIPLIVHLHNY